MKKQDEAILGLASALLAARDLEDLLGQLTLAIRDELGADWVGLWIHEVRESTLTLALQTPEGAMPLAPEEAGEAGDLLSEVLARQNPVIRRGDEIRASTLRHIDPGARPSVREVFLLPFTIDARRTGLIEAIRLLPTSPRLVTSQARFLAACPTLIASAATAVGEASATQARQLVAINRLTQLYDVSQAFHSTLELEALLPIIADRIGLIFEAAACRIWLPGEDGGELRCVFPEQEGLKTDAAEGPRPPWQAFSTGEPQHGSDDEAGSLLCAALIADETSLGAVELFRSADEAPFGPDDSDFLEEIARQAAIAIRNANLLLAESKAQVLDALLDISREITATLDLDRVLNTIVNRADAVVPSNRCAILLAEGKKMELRAISGHLEIDRKDAAIRDLEDVLAWACLGGQSLYIAEADGEIEADREETREKFRRYFERSGMKTFVALPLKDEEGLLGMISTETSEAYSISEEKLEAFTILSNQATVALRNAALYRQIPLINLLQPIVDWKSRLRRMSRWTLARNAGAALAALAALVFVPWPMKVGGTVTVLPARNSIVASEVEGVVEAVYRREGDLIRRGDLVATLVDRDYRLRLEEARSRFDIVGREVAAYEAGASPAAASQARMKRDEFLEEVELYRHKLERTRITSPVDGVVITPRLEQRVGAFLERGDEFCRIADMSAASVEIRVPESEIGEIETGQGVRVKIDSFPTRTFRGRVEIVGEKVVEEPDGRFLIVRARLDGGDLPLRTGMLGRAKIEVGQRRAGYVLLRRPARFAWRILWSWLP